MGCGKRRKDIQQQQSFSVRILGEKLQHIKKAITLNRVCIHQSICMHREHAEARRAASHGGLGNNYSGAVRRALLMDHTNRWREETSRSSALVDAKCHYEFATPAWASHALPLGSCFLKGEMDYTD